jgi:hypothetical protein
VADVFAACLCWLHARLRVELLTNGSVHEMHLVWANMIFGVASTNNVRNQHQKFEQPV